MSKNKIKTLEKKIKYKFKNKELLKIALTHSSYTYENPENKNGHNEKLEFLGDAILNFIVVDYIYKNFPNFSEGELSKLKSTAINTPSLFEFAKQINLGEYLLLGKGELLSGGKTKATILAGAFEALIAAIYLDSGMTKTKKFLNQFLSPFFEKLKGKAFYVDNYKSALQEYYQKRNLPLPTYRVIEESGPEHDKTFKVEVLWEGKSLARAKGRTKKSAEQKAAKKILKKILGKEIKDLVSELFFMHKKGENEKSK